MKKIGLLIQRNLWLFYKNKLVILLSFASVFIVLGIYLMFLRDFLITTVAQSGLAASLTAMFTDRFMMAGLLVVVSTTTCFGMLQICVNDASTGIRRDYLAAPVSKFQIMLGYLIATAVVSALFTGLTSYGCLFALSGKYGFRLHLKQFLQIGGTVAACSFMNAALLLCLSFDLKSTATFSTLANLYGTLIGFLAGTYLPSYFYPNWLRRILFWFPPTQFNSILRQYFLQGVELPPSRQTVLYQDFGITLTRAGDGCTLREQWWITLLLFCLLLFYLRIHSADGRLRTSVRPGR